MKVFQVWDIFGRFQTLYQDAILLLCLAQFCGAYCLNPFQPRSAPLVKMPYFLRRTARVLLLFQGNEGYQDIILLDISVLVELIFSNDSHKIKVVLLAKQCFLQMHLQVEEQPEKFKVKTSFSTVLQLRILYQSGKIPKKYGIG